LSFIFFFFLSFDFSLMISPIASTKLPVLGAVPFFSFGATTGFSTIVFSTVFTTGVATFLAGIVWGVFTGAGVVSVVCALTTGFAGVAFFTGGFGATFTGVVVALVCVLTTGLAVVVFLTGAFLAGVFATGVFATGVFVFYNWLNVICFG
jgi:hypothetical protein